MVLNFGVVTQANLEIALRLDVDSLWNFSVRLLAGPTQKTRLLIKKRIDYLHTACMQLGTEIWRVVKRA